MSDSLTEERDRIQRQVEELEQNLGADPVDLDLLSSDASSYDASDEEIQQTEPGHRMSPGLLAERDQVQQEIEELQTALQSQNPVFLSDDDSNDSEESAGELDIPETDEGCLQVNLVYQQVLIDSLDQLEHLLNQNKRAQKELLFQMAGPTRDLPREPSHTSTSYEQPAKLYLGRFHKPYFKDKLSGLGPPANPETRDRTSRMTTTIDDTRLQVKRWEGWQKTLLINAVSKDGLKRQIQPKLSKVDYLSQKMCSAAGEEEKGAFREQIEQLEKDIQRLRSQEVVGDRYDEHDWQKISNIDFEGIKEADDLRLFWQNYLHPSINKSTWAPEEMKHLAELSKEHGERDWESVAEELGTGRTAFMCLQTYQRYVSKKLKKSSWSAEEDQLLRELVERMRIGNFIPYTQMSYFMEGRDPSQLMYRWVQVLDPSLRKGHWTKEEDKALLRAVARFGEKCWSKIRLEVPGRSDGACRDRYTDCLKAGIRKGAFDMQERKLLLELVKKHGVGRWSRIAAEIPNRFDAQCLREWRKFVKYGKRKPSGGWDSLPAQKRQPAQRLRSSKRREEKEKLVESSEEEEEEEEEEEDEEEEVVYMDSDDGKMKHELEEDDDDEDNEDDEEEKSKREEEKSKREEVPEQGPPHPYPEKLGAVGTLSYQVVERPSYGPLQNEELPVRCTIADANGNLQETLEGLAPRVLRRGTRHSPEAMLRVSGWDLYRFLLSCSGNARDSFRRRRGDRGQDAKSRRSRADNLSRGYVLMAAVTPWIGNLLVPDPTWVGQTSAHALRQRMQAASLSSTPVFRLLLQVLRVDALGCKDVIQQRGQAPTPRLLVRTPRPNSVLALLQQKTQKAQQLKEAQLVAFPPPQPLPHAPCGPQIQWMLVPQGAPQNPSMPLHLDPGSSPDTAPCPHPIMQHVLPRQRPPLPCPHPAGLLRPHGLRPGPWAWQQGPGAVTLTISPARPPGNALVLSQDQPTTFASAAAPPAGTLAPPIPAPTSSAAPDPTPTRGVKRGCSPDPPANQMGSMETQKTKRVRRITAKAMALEELVQSKSHTKCKTSLKRTHGQTGPAGPIALPGGSALAPGQSMWLVTPNGLVSLGGMPPLGLKTALPPAHQGQAAPVDVLLQPHGPCPPTGPPNTLHQARSNHLHQAINFSPMSIQPPSVSTIQPHWTRVPSRPAWQWDAPQPPRREVLQFDPALMFCEPAEEVQAWLSGAGGAVVAGLGMALPYLPPSVCSLDTLHALLASKKHLRESAFQLLPADPPDPTPSPGPDHQYVRSSCGEEATQPMAPECRREATEDDNVAALRRLVSRYCASNPAYQMLKTRFLSCFTVPALLASITLHKEVEVLQTADRRTTEKTTLLQDGEGAPANHFSGIITCRPSDTRQDSSQDTRQDSSQDTRQDSSQDTRQDSSQDTRQDSSQDSSEDQESSDDDSTNK